MFKDNLVSYDASAERLPLLKVKQEGYIQSKKNDN